MKRRWFTRYRGGEPVPEGVYWNLNQPALRAITGVVDFLPGNKEAYLRVPALLVLPAALLLGLLFVVALSLSPLIIAAWLGSTLWRRYFTTSKPFDWRDTGAGEESDEERDGSHPLTDRR